MKYFLLAGEPSGDLHASNLIREIARLDADARFAGLGGDLMQEAGCFLYQNYRQMAFMGFVAVLRNWRKVKDNFSIAKQALLKENPDVLILIDYPSFNLKMARFCKKHLPSTRVVYYIPPKVWAWKRFRVHSIAALSDAVLGIFPFETDFYRSFGYTCTYVGNPTMDSIRSFLSAGAPSSFADRKPYIAVLPGSRPSEISHCLPTMIAAVRKSLGELGREADICIAGAPGIDPEFYSSLADNLPVFFGETYDMLAHAEAAVVNSGTATLETTLLSCPQVAVYRVACPHILKHIWKLIFTIRHFTLPNIIAGREVIKEKVAHLFTVEEVSSELSRILSDSPYRDEMLSSYSQIRASLGDTPAAQNAAKAIIALTH